MYKVLKNGKSINYYDFHEVDALIEKLNGNGYECVQVDEGTLGSGSWICISPNDNYYHYVIKEVPLNSQSSGHIIRRCKKLTKENQEMLQAVGVEYTDEPQWKTEIYTLFKDFCLPIKKAREIIKDIERKYPNKDDDYKYEKAWRVFRAMI